MIKHSVPLGMFLGLLALSAPIHAEEKQGVFFGSIDYFLAGDVGNDIESQSSDAAAELTADGTPATAATETSNGIGGRIGYLRNIHPNFALGGSVGYVSGPTMETEIRLLPDPSGITGYSTAKFKSWYARCMAEGVGKVPMSENITLNLGIALGAAHAETEQEWFAFASNGIYSLSESGQAKKAMLGFTWEISPSVDIHMEKYDINVGMRYSKFPRIGETDETYEIDWKALGFFAGVKF